MGIIADQFGLSFFRCGHKNKSIFKPIHSRRTANVYALEDYTEELAASHGIHSYGGVNLTLTDLNNVTVPLLMALLLLQKALVGVTD